MELLKIILNVILIQLVHTLPINTEEVNNNRTDNIKDIHNPDNVFSGVYTECFLHLSYSCLQQKTLLYLKELNNLSEVSVLGDYVKFVKINTTTFSEEKDPDTGTTEELALLIDKAVDIFFDNHVLKFKALGRDISIPRNMEVFVGRKKRKGGGGGDLMGGHGHDDKKKMMMMAMMCMKMKLMMMVPAMMGMMGMMSFKGMMFSMMSFMISKMLLLMKILEKRGGTGLAGSGGGGDGGWAAAAGGGGAWMPAGQDLSSGGYDANGQWQSRSIAETLDIMNKPTVYIDIDKRTKKSFISKKADKNQFNGFEYKTVLESPEFKPMPEISYIKPVIRFNDKIEEEVLKKPILAYKKSNVVFNSNRAELNDNVEVLQNDLDSSDNYVRVKRSLTNQRDEKIDQIDRKTKAEEAKSSDKVLETMSNINSRKKRSLLDIIQNYYTYWMTTLLGMNNNRRTNFQKYKIINGVPYVYYPFKMLKAKTPKEVQLNSVKYNFKPSITANDFNKGEIIEGGIEARMHRKKFTKMKDIVNDTLEDNPWQ